MKVRYVNPLTVLHVDIVIDEKFRKFARYASDVWYELRPSGREEPLRKIFVEQLEDVYQEYVKDVRDASR